MCLHPDSTLAHSGIACFFSGKKVTAPLSPRVPVCLCSEVYERHLLLCTLFNFFAAGRAVIPDYEQAIQSKQKGVGRFRSVLHEAGKAWTGPKIAAAESKESPKEKAWVIVDSSIWYTQKSWQTPQTNSRTRMQIRLFTLSLPTPHTILKTSCISWN